MTDDFRELATAFLALFGVGVAVSAVSETAFFFFTGLEFLFEGARDFGASDSSDSSFRFFGLTFFSGADFSDLFADFLGPSLDFLEEEEMEVEVEQVDLELPQWILVQMVVLEVSVETVVMEVVYFRPALQ